MHLNPKTMICTSIGASTVGEMWSKAQRAPSDLVELRIDLLDEYTVGELKDMVSGLRSEGKQVIVTLRDHSEGGGFRGTPEEKEYIISRILESRPTYVDIECEHPKAKAVIIRARCMGVRAIISYHDFSKTPSYPSLRRIVERCMCRGGGLAIAKVVTTAVNCSDNLRTMLLCSEFRSRLISFCMGELGVPSRVLAPVFGAPFTYASLGKGENTAPGQISAEEVAYCWRRMSLPEGSTW